jgi:hypothetical protein
MEYALVWKFHNFCGWPADITCLKLCFGPSTGSEIRMFKGFKENWSKRIHHQPEQRDGAVLPASDVLKQLISG